jgi:hypothetical protein
MSNKNTVEEIVEDFETWFVNRKDVVTTHYKIMEWLRTTLATTHQQAFQEGMEAERERIVEWIKTHTMFAEPQVPEDESDEKWEIHYTGYREATKNILRYLTNDQS